MLYVFALCRSFTKVAEPMCMLVQMMRSGVQPMYSVQNAILILHEVQHVEIMHRQLRIYNYTRGASIQHTQMQDYSYMKSRLDFFNENFSSFYKFYAKYPSGSTFMQYLGRWVNAGVANGFSTTDNPNDMYDNINKMGEKKTDIKNFKH